MCELFGLSCNKKDRATFSLPLFARYSDKNWHGWGIGYYKGSEVVVRRQAEKAKLSEEFKKVTQEALSNIIIAHLRLRSRGKICNENCHPFKYPLLQRSWIFAHNGTIDIEYESRVESDTDSARAFTFMMEKIDGYVKGGRIRGLYPAIMYATKELVETYGGTLNYLLSDGIVLYAFCNHRNMYFLRRKKNYGGAILVSTQKLTNERWIIIPKNRLFLVSKGEVVVLSDPMNEFFR